MRTKLEGSRVDKLFQVAIISVATGEDSVAT